MNWNHTKCVIAACALTATALAGTGNEATLSARGFVLQGELLLFPAAEQRLPAGWSVAPEGALTQGASVLELRGFSEVTTRGADLFSIFSQPMATGQAQLVLAQDGATKVGLGDLSLAVAEGSWSLLATGDELSGRPVFELVQGARALNVQSADEFALNGELVLSPAVMAELGLESEQPCVVGALTLLASAYFDPAQPVAERAAPLVTIGPDIIVSTIGTSLTKNGTVGAITAYSFTTVSCNIGDANAIWIDCTSGSNCNQHPVITQEFFRLKPVNGAKQFEEIGMAWLKHGFCAADAPSCGSPYTPHSSCDWLGLFATDTYDAGLNGSQGNMGPHSEVQPFTGVYPYPYILNPGTGNAIYKRTQIHNADIDPSLNVGAEYWAECCYITTDESTTNGTRNNNYSTRKVLLGAQSNTPPGSNLAFTGATIQQVSAVENWANVEAGVSVQYVDVPGDGRFILGYKATDIGGGQFHYEYALLNANSDRSGQAFEVPLSPGASCTNVGFHDVDYHSGEPYALTDWTPTVTFNSNVSWAAQTYAQNVNANALRWNTTYSYRFDSNGTPTPGTVTLTLFKPGSPTTVTFAADVPGQACSIFNYCSTSLTTNGCAPAISGAGTPSATAPSGFTLDCTSVEGQQSGIYFFGFTPIASVWAMGSTSTRCVANPVVRMTPQATGGTVGQCDGAFSVDWNAWIAAHPSVPGTPLYVGESFYAQAWFRDPAAVTGTNLSGGLGFTLCP